MDKFIVILSLFFNWFFPLLKTANNLTLLLLLLNRREGGKTNKQTSVTVRKVGKSHPLMRSVTEPLVLLEAPVSPRLSWGLVLVFLDSFPEHTPHTLSPPAGWFLHSGLSELKVKKWARDVFCFLGRCWDDGEDAQGRSLLVFHCWIPAPRPSNI